MAAQHAFMETVKELIQLHNDRITLYHHALSTLLQPGRQDLKAIFGEMIRESMQYQQELKDSIAGLNGKINYEEQEFKGTIYEVWEDGKGEIQGDSSKAILETCEQECAAVQQAYQAALTFSEPIHPPVRLLLKMQQVNLKSIQDQIREYHDAL